MPSSDLSGRYGRQMLLPDFGEEKQRRLLAGSVLVIGAGGLGCPALLYLAAAGVGRLGVVDFDRVETSNLHRQVLYNAADIGQPKAEVAAARIRAANPDTAVDVFNTRIDTGNALGIIGRYDLVVDGSDNFPTRYLVNDACVLLGKPLVYGSVYRYEGQVGVFNFPDSATGTRISYRDLFPHPPAPEEVPNCAEAGVLGVLPGIIGTMQAGEAIKLLTGLGEPLAGRLLTYHSLHNSFFEFRLSPDPEGTTAAPGSEEAFKRADYDFFCGQETGRAKEVLPEEFERLAGEENWLLIDVRNPGEQPKLASYPYLSVPLSGLENRLPELQGAENLLVFCQAGARSLKAARIISEKYSNTKVYSLKGGINAWADYQKSKHAFKTDLPGNQPTIP
jgi:adenylyltransferase/sulfurtransferase